MPEVGPRNPLQDAADAMAGAAKRMGYLAVGAAAELASNATEVAQDAGKVVTDAGQDAVKNLQDAGQNTGDAIVRAAQDAQRSMELKRLHPVFPDQLRDPVFQRPKMVSIQEPDTQHKNSPVCRGAIGWISVEAGVTVLHLYDDAVDESGINFFPYPLCDKVYFEDTHDKSRLVDLSCYFDVAQKDKLTELKGIARDLGATHCRLETYKMSKMISLRDGRAGVKVVDKRKMSPKTADAMADVDLGYEKSVESRLSFDVKYTGCASPKTPTLNWYAKDSEINDLIHNRINGDSLEESYSVTLDQKTSETMSMKTAAKIDAALSKMKATANFTYSGEVKAEERLMMKLDFEFGKHSADAEDLAEVL